MMEKKDKKTIKVIDLVGADTISSRDIIASFSSKINKYSKFNIILDFSKIQFISRSAAHELIKLKTANPNISFNNMTEEISEILRVVAANMVSPKKKTSDFSPKRTTLSSLLNH